MKYAFVLAMCTAVVPFCQLNATAAKNSPHHIVERGANYRVWQHAVTSTGPNGKLVVKTNSYTELGTGLCYQDKKGKWIDADPQIIGQADGTGQGNNAQHSIRFLPDISADGSILSSAGGKQLRSHVLGICYYDSKNQREMQVGAIQSSVGKIVGKNQVVYANAFSGLKADVRYEYKKAGMGQDIIFREQLPSPSDFQMDPATTRVEVWTEFLQPPAPKLHKTRVGRDGQQDHPIIDFDGVRIGQGAAFATPNAKAKFPVKKQWQTINGRTFLIESLEFETIQSELANLPQRAQAALQKPADAVSKVAKDRHAPSRIASTPKLNQKIQIATAVPEEKGFVLDYETITGEVYGDFTFQGGNTYYISSGLQVDGNVTFEGGTVIKFGLEGGIEGNNVICATAPYRPAIFTSLNNDSVGERIDGSSGMPVLLTDCSPFANNATGDLHDLRFSYIGHPVSYFSTVRNVQCIHCPYPLTVLGDTVAENCLFYDFNTLATGPSWWPYQSYGPAGSVELYNVTASSGSAIVQAGNVQGNVAVNCIFSGISDTSNVDGNYNGFYNANPFGDFPFNSANVPFQSGGMGQFYLAAPEFKGVGAADVPSDLLAALATKTTQPPLSFGDDIGDGTVLSPQVAHDTNSSPDLGYHYDPIDYAINGRMIFGNVVLTNGVVVASYYDTQPISLTLDWGSSLVSEGTATAHNRIVGYNTVQELAGGSQDGAEMISSYGNQTQIRCRFTDFCQLAGPVSHIGTENPFSGVVSLTDCQFYGGAGCTFAPWNDGTVLNLAVTNCLFYYGGFNVNVDEGQLANLVAYNNLFYYTALSSYPGSWSPSSTYTIKDNLFYQSDVEMNLSEANLSADYNAHFPQNQWSYLPNFSIPGPHDVVLNSFSFQSGPSGDFYQPANSVLLNAGSRSAADAGLYHYTVLPNQVKEGTNPVSIGYHYVALDGNGNPVDTNGDGIPDYVADANGNGNVDAGETSWGPPAFTTQPVSQTALTNTAVIFQAAGDNPSVTYQWKLNGTDISGATTTALTLSNVQFANAGSYSVVICDSDGCTTSSAATLKVVDEFSFGLVAYYPLNGDAHDASGNGNDGNAVNVTFGPDRNSQTGKAADFSSGNAYIDIPTLSTMAYTPATYSAWFKLNDYPVITENNYIYWSIMTIVGRDAGSADGALCLYTESEEGKSNSLVYYSNDNVAGSGVTPATGQWTHVVFTIDESQNTSFYLNGQLANSGQFSGDQGSESPFRIGASAWFDDVRVGWNGLIDEVRVYNRALSADEVAQLYALNPAPTITTPPQSATANVGANATFSVSATGATPMTYQWLLNGAAISGATSSSYSAVNPQMSDSGSSYSVVVANDYGTVTSSAAVLTVWSTPSISSQPQSLTSYVNSSYAIFNVTATGTPTPTYQWRSNNVNLVSNSRILGATGNSLWINLVQTSDEATYTVVVQNGAGTITSQPATLTVYKTPSISSQPQSITVNPGDNATFAVTASGIPTPTYQWRSNNVNLANNSRIAGATTSSLTILSAQSSDAATYTVAVQNPAGTVVSQQATLTLNIPPSISAQPQSATKATGSSAAFSVTASATPAPTYQWKKNGNNISGATLSSYSIANLQSSDAGSYNVVVSNSAGTAPSSVATLTVAAAPTIAVQPSSQTADEGSLLYISVNAIGAAPLSYQWQANGVNLPTGTTATLTFNSLQASNGGTYIVIITNLVGSATSTPATLTVITHPVITGQPVSQTLNEGQSTNFTVVASGNPLTYQWQFNGVNISGETTSTLSKINVQSSDAGSYTVIITNVLGTVTSTPATLAVIVPPSITSQPASQTLKQGNTVMFTVTATGTSPSYQWKLNGANITGATASVYSKANISQSLDSGTYTVVLTNLAGSVTSTPATLNIGIPPSITTQPVSLSVMPGDSATFSVSATGDPVIRYHWQFDNNPIDATSSTFTIPHVQCSDAGTYEVLAANDVDQTESISATLTVGPSITVQPANPTLDKGATANFSVTACGTPPLTYHWYFNGSAISGATKSTYSKATIATTAAGSYTVVVANAAGSVPSDAGALTVNSIAVSPSGQTVNETEPATFSAVATGTSPTMYQWRKNGTLIPGASGSTYSSYTIPSAEAVDAANYSVTATFNVTSGGNTLTSPNATLAVIIAPTISSGPASQSVLQGHSAIFTVTATGTAPLNYQWQSNTINLADNSKIAGSSSSSLTILNAQPTDAASYTVFVANSAGSVTSDPATLTVDSIVVQPSSQTFNDGDTRPATFSAVSTGSSPTYLWQKNGVSISGATSSTYSITPIHGSDAATYTVTATFGTTGPLNSSATLTVNTIAVQPQSQSVGLNLSATFTAVSTGTSPTSYQWQHNGVPINGATSSTLTLTGLQSGDSGSYAVVIANNLGTLTSAPPGVLNVIVPATIAPGLYPQTKNSGDTVVFSAVVSGTAPISYQWSHGGINLANGTLGDGCTVSGSQTSALTLSPITLQEAGSYRITVGNIAGGSSVGTTLTVYAPPVITTPPASQTVIQGSTASFSVVATANPAPSYQWKFDGNDIIGATSSSYSIPSATSANTGTYSVFVSNTLGSTTPSATLTMDIPPVITVPPLSQTVNPGTTVTFNAVATGTPSVAYKWQFDGIDIPGQTTGTLTIPNAQNSNAGTYTVIVTNRAGTTSASATLTVNVAPLITIPPADQTSVPGLPVVFNVQATGTAPLSYQWQQNGVNITGATSTAYLLTNVQPSDAGTYTVVITDVAGTTTGSATLTVITSEPDCGSDSPSLLAYWSFDSSDNSLAGDRGQLPVTSDGVQSVDGESDTAIGFTGFWQHLNYRYIDTDGLPNINCQKGAIAFWFKPNTNDLAAHQSESLVQVGDKYDCTGGWWSFGLDNSGTSLTFQTMSNGVQTTFLTTTAPNWDPSQWYHLILSYSPTATKLYINGAAVATGDGVTNYPSLVIRQLYGLTIGPSDRHDCCEAPGSIDEFKTFNCPLQDSDIPSVYPGP